MLFEVIVRPGSGALRLVGELDISTASLLEEALHEPTSLGGDVVLDLSELSFIDSTGLQALLALGRDLGQGGRLVLHSLSPAVARVFELTGLLYDSPFLIINARGADRQ
ncbi:MAG: STAS domain-containing protein [Actinomycetota bacterium]